MQLLTTYTISFNDLVCFLQFSVHCVLQAIKSGSLLALSQEQRVKINRRFGPISNPCGLQPYNRNLLFYLLKQQIIYPPGRMTLAARKVCLIIFSYTHMVCV